MKAKSRRKKKNGRNKLKELNGKLEFKLVAG
jgi:hypothetical protein